MQITGHQAEQTAGHKVHALLPLHAHAASAADAAALPVLASVLRAASWREVALTDLQALLGLYTAADAPRIALLQNAQVQTTFSILTVLFERLLQLLLHFVSVASSGGPCMRGSHCTVACALASNLASMLE
jgi:hypothetical protein